LAEKQAGSNPASLSLLWSLLPTAHCLLRTILLQE
jgi:hypothetical protein